MPGGPLISVVGGVRGEAGELRPLTATITSPACRPARCAGEVSNTRAIASPLCSGETTTPMPVKLGGGSNSWNSFGVR